MPTERIRAQDGSHLQAPGDGGSGAYLMEHSADQGPIGRTEGPSERRPTCPAEEPSCRAQSCGSEEGHPRHLCQGLGDSCALQRHHQCALCKVRGEDLNDGPSNQQRPGEFRQALRREVQGDPGGMPLLCRVGCHHSQRESRGIVAPEAPGNVADKHDGRATSQAVQEDREGSPSVGLPSPSQQGIPERVIDRPIRRILHEDPNRRFRIRDESPESRTGSAPLREQLDDSSDVSQQVPQGDLSGPEDSEDSSEWEDCPEFQCFQAHRKIGQSWLESRNPYGKSWEELTSLSRLFLLEVACSERSLLSEEVLSRNGPNSAMRCAHWNGFDLTTRSGVDKLKQLIRERRPKHIWISCECGPFSPLQRINQRTAQQREELQRKREAAVQQYQGGIEVARFGRRHGSQIHWELSEKCEAWNLPIIQSFLEEQHLKRVTCHGCTVNLRAHDTGELMCKGWTIATKNFNILRHMNLQCQRNHKHTVCESGRTHHSAFYTPVFAKKVVDALQEQEAWSALSQELSLTPSEVSDQFFCLENSETCLVNEGELSSDEKIKINNLLRHIHSVTGHGSVETLVKSLKNRGVPEKVLALAIARQFRCPLCEERKRVVPRRTATLETAPLKWQRVQSDLGSWTHPLTHHKIKFILFIDEGCRFRTGRILFENSREQATWPVVRKAFEELWISTFGMPEGIRADPEGVWRSDEAAAYCQERSIALTPVPAEAHWQIGIVEEAIKATKHVLDTLTTEFPDMELSECFARAIWACNSRDNSYGYSPAQHAMGRNPDEWGRLFTSKVDDGHPIHPQQFVDGGFGENIKAMAAAEQSFSRFQAQARLARAEAAGRRPMKHLVPGDLVFYWRKQVQGGQGRGFSWSGQFLGPARVLAVETREDEQGRLRPGSCVWLHRAGRLIKAAPEQLRQASSRERAVEELKGPVEIPWAITSLATHPQRKTYWDISAEKPTDLQWQEASEHPTGGRRYSSKKRPTVDQPAVSSSQPMEDITVDPQQADDDVVMETGGVPNKSETETDEAMSAVEISIDIPNSKRGLKRFIEDPVAFVVSQMKRNTVEVRERTLTDEELAQFKQAKDKEVRSYIQSHCFKVLPLAQQDKFDSVGMRWVLTWKGLEDGSGGHKAKARAVILGYQDKNYEFKQTASPTLSRSGRQAFLAFCSQCHFRVRKGDVSSAFLQGEVLEDGMKSAAHSRDM